MNVVGIVGSLISQGVYSVATPFHPFGGAVDVIVVEQEDGTYRSTPWYVRFGKFQGVLKGAEKVVTITVNGVEANFHMYLDNSGQAYFLREIVSGSNDDESSNQITGELSSLPPSVGSGNYENTGDDRLHRHANFGLKKEDAVDNDEDLFRYQDEQASPGSSVESSSFSNYQYGSLDEVENMVKESGDASEEMVLISIDGHVLTAPISSNEENTDDIQLDTPQFHLGPGEGTSGNFTGSGDMWDPGLFGHLEAPTLKDEETSEHRLHSPKDYEDDSTLKNEETSKHQIQICKECEDKSTLKEEETSDHQLQSPKECLVDSALKDEETSDHQLRSPKEDEEDDLSLKNENEVTSEHQLQGGEEFEDDSTLKDQETSDHQLQNPKERDVGSALENERTSSHQIQSPKECENDSTSNDVKASEYLLKSPRECDDSVHVEDAENVIQTETDNKGWGVGLRKEDVFQSCLDLMSQVQDVDAQDISLSNEINLETKPVSPEKHPLINTESSRTDVKNDLEFRSAELHTIEAATTENLKHDSSGDTECKEDGNDSQCSVQQVSGISCAASIHSETQEHDTCEERISNAENLVQENFCEQSISSPISSFTEEGHQTESADTSKNMIGLGFEISLCGNLLRPGMGRNSAEEAFDSQRISEDVFKASGPSIIKNGNLIVRYRNKYYKWEKASHIIVGKAVFGPKFSVELSDSIEIEYEDTTKYRDDASGISPSPSRRWRLWPIPFRRSSKSLRHTNSEASSEDLFLDSESGFQTPDKECSTTQSPRRQYARTNIPTNEQVASLKLKDGQNMVTFSFSTRVLGRQQVDAHIYLWKWNARIVISDVDGTITKSDVLGQFMPLVGKDWTQSGVARLFCAIKENGYQLLFLSARAIVQAYLTRSFLLNLKQDGKALPSGPVVISPDGLFPSLYREVIRRAPHEFKIACLEDIKALFPSDYNPFYAGFGNRDTDELSYRKIGIPKGKIFIINPKGEVAINNCVAVKSYTSLHTLVHDMFPPTSLVEQEDFNSWNYWKMPLMEINE